MHSCIYVTKDVIMAFSVFSQLRGAFWVGKEKYFLGKTMGLCHLQQCSFLCEIKHYKVVR